MVDDDEMQEIAKRSKLIGIEEFPDIASGGHSHVCHSGDGSFRSYSVYRAPNPERLREHARARRARHQRLLRDHR